MHCNIIVSALQKETLQITAFDNLIMQMKQSAKCCDYCRLSNSI